MKYSVRAAAIAAGACLSPAAMAQVDPVGAIEACRDGTANDAERIACLEDALRSLAPTAAARAEAPAAAPAPDVAKTPDAAPAPLAAAPETPPEPVIAGIGAEQVRARAERETKEGKKQRKERLTKEAVEARLVDFARTATGRLVLVLDNGQVWAQRSGDQQEVRLRKGDTPTLTIRRGAISGYRIEFSSPNVTIVAERLK